ncbi:MAG: 2-amino-4-hydroxy-6-hydroxymethyldihydropteridine diphosphokinase [Chitinophagaceae bacterium]|jgi:2-amino-4-hydroxy-6-hydroxymethyldihydropteridine diphosphokinase|nr:2-amino-4-hydroxy-6-hydroxymethyldihydropteridine diphosphokinase [Chitinophagaceae bacterium]
MNTAFLLIGGNIGNRFHNLEKARSLINQQCGNIIKTSSIYETAAWGMVQQSHFLNQVLSLNTKLSASELLKCILTSEQKMGRIRKQKSGPRIIDIDLLFYNDDMITEPRLVVPHPRLHLRKFALEPMNEIAPHHIHPGFSKTISELLGTCEDELSVQKL